MKRSNAYKWTIGALIFVFLVGGAMVLAHGYGRDDAPYTGAFTGPLPSEIQDAALEALDAEYAAYAAYDALISRYGKLEPYVTLREMVEHNIEMLEDFIGNYQVAYPTPNPYMDAIVLPGTLSETAAELAKRTAAKAAIYADILERTESYRGIDRLFSYLARTSLKRELPALELAAKSGGELSPAQMARLGFGAERGPFGPYGMMDGDDEYCPMWRGMWNGRMGMHGHGGRNDSY